MAWIQSQDSRLSFPKQLSNFEVKIKRKNASDQNNNMLLEKWVFKNFLGPFYDEVTHHSFYEWISTVWKRV